MFTYRLHYAQENQKNELCDFGSAVLYLKERGKRYCNNKHAGKDIDCRRAEAERSEIYTSPRLFRTPRFGDWRALKDADKEGGPIIADDEKSRCIDYNASPSNNQAVNPLEQSKIDDAKREFGEQCGHLEEYLVQPI